MYNELLLFVATPWVPSWQPTGTCVTSWLVFRCDWKATHSSHSLFLLLIHIVACGSTTTHLQKYRFALPSVSDRHLSLTGWFLQLYNSTPPINFSCLYMNGLFRISFLQKKYRFILFFEVNVDSSFSKTLLAYYTLYSTVREIITVTSNAVQRWCLK